MLKKAFFFPIFLFAYNQDILNNYKSGELNFEKKYSIENSKEIGKSWLNPITFSYSISKTDLTPEHSTKSFTVNINQPVFKSGAIYYSIKYAKNLKNYNLKNIELKKRELIKNALDLVIDYKINQIKKKIVKLEIENAKIDIEKKKEAFLNGVGDSTLLNDAVLKLNSLKLNLADIDLTLFKLKKNFEKISSLNIESVKLPDFKIIGKDYYVNKNLEYISAEKKIKIKKDLYKMNLGNNLLSINLNGNYNIVKNTYKHNLQHLNESTYNYYNIGISLNLPLKFNARNSIEKSKIDYLKSETELKDKKNELEKVYETLLKKLQNITEKIKIYRENIKIYNSLINSTKDAVRAGDATGLDLKIMQNSQKTSFLNIYILKLESKKILLEIYYNLSVF